MYRIAMGLLLGSILGAGPLQASGKYYEVTYPPSEKPGELVIGVTFTVWIPEGVSKIRGVIVHQHGCGTGACQGGATAAYDLHWQALAKKWDCALLGPSYHQQDKQNCRLWCDPRNGSAKTFLRALHDLAEKAKHPELEHAPWCLWGHSGGAFWSSLMQTEFPQRIVAIWFRSGTAFSAWQAGEIPPPKIPQAAYQIPMMLNPGAKENGDRRFQSAWTGSLAMFRAYRAQGALIGFAPDPKTSHECGESRYLAIPFFDACLALRLPEVGATNPTQLKPIDPKTGWLAPLLGQRAVPAAQFTGTIAESVWLPNEAVASAWAQYVQTGTIDDRTPPPAPYHVRALRQSPNRVLLTWQADADFDSGLRGFRIERDGQQIAELPEKPSKSPGRPLFQGLSYHDTPNPPLAEMKFLDTSVPPDKVPTYRIIAVNSLGLVSPPSQAVTPAER